MTSLESNAPANDVVQNILLRLVSEVPSAIGAVVFDANGESMASVLGPVPMPEEARARAINDIPRGWRARVAMDEFIWRTAAVEPSQIVEAISRRTKGGASTRFVGLDMRFSGADALVRHIGDDAYLFVVVAGERALGALSARLAKLEAELAQALDSDA